MMTLEADSVNVQALDMGHIVVDIDGVNITELINKAAENYSEEQLKYLDEIMINCSRYELMFWDMAYKMEY